MIILLKRLAVPAPGWRRNPADRPRTANRGPAPPSPSSDWSCRSACRASLQQRRTDVEKNWRTAHVHSINRLFYFYFFFPWIRVFFFFSTALQAAVTTYLWCRCRRSTPGRTGLPRSPASGCWSWGWSPLSFPLRHQKPNQTVDSCTATVQHVDSYITIIYYDGIMSVFGSPLFATDYIIFCGIPNTWNTFICT